MDIDKLIELVKKWHEEDIPDDYFEWAEKNIGDPVETSEGVDGKTIIVTALYQCKESGRFVEVTQCRDNCGYWGDGETYEAEACQVWRVPVASWQTVYKDPEA